MTVTTTTKLVFLRRSTVVADHNSETGIRCRGSVAKNGKNMATSEGKRHAINKK